MMVSVFVMVAMLMDDHWRAAAVVDRRAAVLVGRIAAIGIVRHLWREEQRMVRRPRKDAVLYRGGILI